MTKKFIPLTTLIFASLVFFTSHLFSQEKTSGESRFEKRISAQKLLEQGLQSGTLPAGVVVRVSAHMFGVDEEMSEKAKLQGIILEKELKETWEFTAKEVYRLVYEEDQQGKYHYKRVESRPFDSKLLCKELLDGRFLEIGTGKGTGEPLQYVGTHFQMGGRSVELRKDGEEESYVTIYEHCTCAGYPESDAKALAELYEKLAKQGREAFSKKEKSNK